MLTGILWKKMNNIWQPPKAFYKKQGNEYKEGNLFVKCNDKWYKTEQVWMENLFIFPNSLGNFISDGNIEHDYFTSEEDGDPVVLTYNNFTINEGHIVTPSNRCKGLYLNILGDLIVNGTLSMTARGAYAEGKYVGIDTDKKYIFYASRKAYPEYFQVIYPKGGLGSNNAIGGAGVNGACGAGGGCYRVRGGHGTSFSGGAGAGGGSYGTVSTHPLGTQGSDNGGPGGAGTRQGGNNAAYGGGGGAGNPGGVCTATTNAQTRPGQDGTGGLLILFVQGNIIVGENGSIQSNGSQGGAGEKGRTSVRYASHPGSGSGGGAIHIFHHKTISGIENIIANGGLAGPTDITTPDNFGTYAQAGGNGTINIVQI